ncbi:MAG: DivIVA domain-containing protein [Acidimicrobiales bacterium]
MVTSRFPVVRRGYEPKAVDATLAELDDLADRVRHAEATTLAARTYAASLLDELERLHALEDELTTSLDLARQTAARILDEAARAAAEMISEAEVQAGARLVVAELESRHQLEQANQTAISRVSEATAWAEALRADADGRATARLQDAKRQAALRLATAEHRAHSLVSSAQHQAQEQLQHADTSSTALLAATDLAVAEQMAAAQAELDDRAAQLDRYRQAVLGEIDLLGRAEARLGPRLSRASARLIEVVDAPDGLGAFTTTTDALVTLARRLQRANLDATLAGVTLDLGQQEVVFRMSTTGSLASADPAAVMIDLRGTPVAAGPMLPMLPMVSVADPAADPSLPSPVRAPHLGT